MHPFVFARVAGPSRAFIFAEAAEASAKDFLDMASATRLGKESRALRRGVCVEEVRAKQRYGGRDRHTVRERQRITARDNIPGESRAKYRQR